MDSTGLLKGIEGAFGWRDSVPRLVVADAPKDEIYADVQSFSGLHWRELTAEKLRSSPDAIYGLAPEAFKYFLPGFLSVPVKVGSVDFLVCHSLVGMLNRGSDPALWDVFFLERWSGLTLAEYGISQDWLLWVSEVNSGNFEDVELSRAFDTIGLLSALTFK
ncbi:hypothetical protein JR065_16430 [Xanthomonas sp. AmX2]|uniref:hypothetical protein n=1 Tax=Xanthomonas sp. TaxID=29446 RepID=UPI00198174FF|nr:hypothetical protein [Xanthomonas sp.]MBN6151934.1 hypothetical protein [Xanthomonas sp.]